MRVGITGATGFVGRRLSRELVARGDSVVAFSRAPSRAAQGLPPTVECLGLSDITPEVMSRLDAVVNLAGEPVAAQRWDDERKRRIRDSRVGVTRSVVDAIAGCDARPRVLVNASAVGYYGPRGDEDVTEAADAGSDFLAGVCVDWESEATRVEAHGVRVVRARIGVVLGDDGGALDKMVPAFKMFVGGPVGDGRQYVPWVHVDDVVGMILHAMDVPEVRGAINVTAPSPARFSEFAKAIGDALRRPSWLTVPGFVLRAVTGELSDVLLTGQRALPTVALATGYTFRYAKLRDALSKALAGR